MQASWQSVTAKDEASFDKTMNDLRTKVDELGYDSVQKVDQDNAKALIKARDAVVKESAK